MEIEGNHLIIDGVEYDLIPVTRDELKDIRRKHIPSVVIEPEKNQYLWTKLPEQTSLIQENPWNGTWHLCGVPCKYVGECPKAWKKGIERFPFIEQGFETIDLKYSTGNEATTFLVVKCKFYEEFIL